MLTIDEIRSVRDLLVCQTIYTYGLVKKKKCFKSVFQDKNIKLRLNVILSNIRLGFNILLI